MNLSSRWCVTAVVALGALACSDPVPPASQGAFIASVRSVSPAPVGKMCPSGAALTFDVPNINDTKPAEVLDGDTYLHKIIDGEDTSTVNCSVKGKSTFTFGGRIALGPRAIEISNGTMGANMKGTARITLTDSGMPGFSHALSAPSVTSCTIDASAMTASGFQVKAGSMWASFSCSSVEAQPSDYCKADGFFVLENCSQ
jgi:hypothetical protein